MPRAPRGSFTHGASAYARNACRCREICTPAWRIRARERRAAGKDAMNSGRPVLVADGATIELTARQGEILEAWLTDGADLHTVARRVGLAERTVSSLLVSVRKAFDYETRYELLAALLLGHAGYEVVESTEEQRDAA